MSPETSMAALRQALAQLEAGSAPGAFGLFPLGAASLDAALHGGLARGVLHELVARQGVGDAAATGGFGLGLALRAAAGRPLVWVRQDYVDRETGNLYGMGLAAFGLDPDRLVLVRGQKPADVLRAANEAARSPAVGAVLVELWGAPGVLDLKATRRLSLAAGRSGATLILIRLGAEPAPTAATTRWAVASAASAPLEANAPGKPAFAITLLRHRAGLPSRTWHLEWNSDSASFGDTAPLPRFVVPVPAGRKDAPPGAEPPSTFPWRRAG